MPSGLIDEEDGVGSWCDRLGDFREVQVHRFGIAGGQDQSRALAQFRADGTEDIGRWGSLWVIQFADFGLCGRPRILAPVFGAPSPHPKIPFPALGLRREFRPHSHPSPPASRLRTAHLKSEA